MGIVSKSTIKNKFPNGGKIFDWLLKNKYLKKITATDGPITAITDDLRTNIKKEFPEECEKVLDFLEQALSVLRLDKEQQARFSREACKGNKEAQDAIYKAYFKAILGYISSISMQDADAKNLSQEFWIDILFNKIICKYKSKYKSKEILLYTFLRRIAHNKVVDYYRKRKKHLWIQIIEEITPSDEGLTTPNEDEGNSDIGGGSLINDDEIVTNEYLCGIYKKLLIHISQNGGYPHQIIVFSFGKLFNNWEPRNIVAQLSNIPLRKLFDKLYEDYLTKSGLPKEEVTNCFSPLKKKMDLVVDEVISEKESKKKLKPHLNKAVGETTLKDYYRKEPSSSISDWIYGATNRLRRKADILTKEQVVKGGLNWDSVFYKLIDNDWAKWINSKEVFLTADFDAIQDKLLSEFGEDLPKFLRILQQGRENL